MGTIKKFITSCKNRLNTISLCHEAANCALLLGIIVTVVALGFVVAGHRVETKYFFIPLACSILFLLARFITVHYSEDKAASFADKFFDLKESLISAIEFEKEKDKTPFHNLQITQTSELCKDKNIEDIRYFFPVKKLFYATSLFAITAWICTFENSEAVDFAKRLGEDSLEKTKLINETLIKKLKELKKELTPEEKELLEKSMLEKDLKKLNKTNDRKEAMRQYASLERNIRSISERMNMAEDRRLLQEISKMLRRRRETQKIGNMLNRKDYKKASREFEKMKMNTDPAKMNENKAKLEQLKKIAEQMKNALENLPNSQSKFKENAKNLSKSIKEFDKQMSKAMKELAERGDCKECQKMLDKSGKELNGKLMKMSRDLKDHDTKNSFLMKLAKMRDALKAGQKGMAMMPGKGGKNVIMGMSKRPGKGKGKGIGAGTHLSENKDGIEDSNRGITTKLTGQKGSCPSEKSIENTAAGTGVSRLSGHADDKDVKFQVESFVEREDVPDSMKDGVKKYFEIIHED